MRRTRLFALSLAGLVVASLAPVATASAAAPHHSVQSASTAKRTPIEGRLYYYLDCDIYAIDPDGANKERLTHTRVCEGPAKISPDGTRLAYYLATPLQRDPFAIGVMDLATGHRSQYKVPSLLGALSWAPDSKTIMYSYYPHHEYKIGLMQANGTHRRTLDTGFKIGYQSVFSADGKRVYFTTDAEAFRSSIHGCSYAPSAIYSIGLHGGHHVLVRGNTRLDSYPADDGAQLLSESSTLGHDQRGEGCLPRHVVDSLYVGKKLIIRNAWGGHYSLDGQHIFYVDRTTNKLCLATVRGRHRQVVPGIPKGAFTASWGPAVPTLAATS